MSRDANGANNGQDAPDGANGHIASTPPLLQRWRHEVASFVRFLPFARDAALDRIRRTSRKQFVYDLPMLVRLGFNYYRGTRRGSRADEPDAPPAMDPYEAWQQVNRWSAGARDELVLRLKQCAGACPKISVLMPVYNAPIRFLDMAIRSVVEQVYDNWELCIADDASTDPAVAEALKRWEGRDGRIKVVWREKNGHISRATNSAAEIASGEFFLFLDQDDELTPDCLAEVALYAAQYPEADFIYSDSDKVDEQQKRYHPEFKPDFSPELLLSYMYFTHVCAVRRGTFAEVGGVRVGFEGSQDYDFALRATEQSRKVGHIPRVLYHWRSVAGSTARSGSAKPASFDAGRRGVQEALDRRGVRGQAVQPEWAIAGGLGLYSCEFPDDGPSVTLIVPTKNRVATLRKCIDSLDRTTYRNYQVIIVDNESDEAPTLQYLSSTRHRVLRVDTGGKFSFAAVNNRAAEAADSQFVLLLNNDTEVIEPKWLSRMMGYAQLQGVGAVGARLLYPDGRVQHAGIVHGLHDGLAGHAFKLAPRWDQGYLSHARVSRNYAGVTAACLLTPRELFLDQGGLDEKQFAVAYNDCDYCYKLIAKGYRCVYVPGAELMHYEGLSRGFNDNPREVITYRNKYGHWSDPYYNANLSLDDERFAIQPRRHLGGPVRRLRVCVFSHFLNYTGAPLIQYEVARELTRRGVIEPVVACVPDGPLRAAYEAIGATVNIFGEHPLAPVLGAPDTFEQAMETLGRTMKEIWKVDVVYANTLDTVFAVDAAHRVGLPVVWNIHESEGWRAYFSRYGVLLARKCLDCFPKPYRVIFGSDATRKVYEPWDSARNFTTIRNPVDPARWEQQPTAQDRDQSRADLSIAPGQIVLLTVGTICPRKGQMDLIQAIARLPDAIQRQVRCFLVGDYPSSYSSEIQQIVASLAPDLQRRITLVAETADVARYYAAADIFVCSSRIECYPRVTQEAMAFGLPIITTPVYGIAEQIRPHVNGVFYNPGDMQQLASSIMHLIENPQLRIDMQTKAPLVLESLGSFARSADRYQQIFQEAFVASL